MINIKFDLNSFCVGQSSMYYISTTTTVIV